jgi:hypothetical protein
MCRWPAVATVSFAVLASHAGSAAAASTPAATVQRPIADAVDVQPGATCLDERNLEAHVQMWLGRSGVPPAVRVFVQGVGRRTDAVEFRIVRQGKIRWRKFDPIPSACGEAHAALGLAIALAIDEGLLKELGDRHHEPVSHGLVIGFELAGGYQVIPGYSGGLKAGVDYGVLSWLRPRAEALFQHSRDNEIEGSSGVFDATLFAGTLGLCAGGAFSETLRLAMCTSVIGGAVHSKGSGYLISSARTGKFFSVSSGMRMSVELGVTWLLDLDLVFPVRVPRFTVERPGTTDLYRDPGAVGVLIGVGPAFEL